MSFDPEKIQEMIDNAEDGLVKILKQVDATVDLHSGAAQEILDTVTDALRTKQPKAYERTEYGYRKTQTGPRYTNIPNEHAMEYERHNKGTQAAYQHPKWKMPQLFKKTGGQRFGSLIRALFGGGGFLIAGVIFCLKAFGAPLWLALGIPLLVLGVINGIDGAKGVALVDRFNEYVKVVGNKTVIELQKLSEITGRSVKYLRKDLQTMMDKKMFRQGHFDENMDNLIVSDEAFQDYRKMLENRKAERQTQADEEKVWRDAGMSETGIEIMKQGELYLSKIERMNAELPGFVITSKLQRLQNVVRSMLEHVRKNPDKVGELRRMMNYYLPTTTKLLETYIDIEKENVKTEQMTRTQEEIEKSLDTINTSFEKKLDDMQQTEAWDVSADISVLNTMLSQDGLKNDNLTSVK